MTSNSDRNRSQNQNGKQKDLWVNQQINVSKKCARHPSSRSERKTDSVISSDSDIRFTRRKLGDNQKCGCAVIAALLIFALFATIGTYIGYNLFKFDSLPERIFRVKLKVTSGDNWTTELADQSSLRFQHRAKFYQDAFDAMINRSDLKQGYKRSEVLALDGWSQSSSTNAAAAAAASLSIASNLLTADSTSSTNILNEQISALFPKCRPKNDANLNKTALYIETNNTALASASLLLASSPSNGDYKNQNQFFGDSESQQNTLIDNTRAYTRNMNNQNADVSHNDGASEHIMSQNNIGGIVETASRMNHAGYSTRMYQHNSNSNSNYQRIANNQQHQSSEYLGGFENSNQMSKGHSKWENSTNDIRKWVENDDFIRDGNIWEKRRRTPNTTPASTVLNSPDFNEGHHYSHNPVQHQIKVGRSPVNQHDHNKEKNNTSPIMSPIQSHPRSTKRPATLVSDGEIVVFDDIDNWRNQNDKHFITQGKPQTLQQINHSNNKSQTNHRFNPILFDNDDDDEGDSNTNSLSTENVTKMIGILPIAEYEGSPRRFGLYQQDLPLHQYQYTSTTNQQHLERPPSSRKMLTSPTLFPPRPGFPKRITTSPSNGSINGTINDEISKSNNASGFEYQNNSLNYRAPSVSPTQITSSPIVSNKRAITCDSNSPSNPQAVPIPSQNSPSSPLEHEKCSVAASENNAKTSPYTDRINLLGNHTSNSNNYLPSTTLSNNANRSSFTTTAPNTTTFDYLYEFSETRKVLEDFFKCPTNEEEKKIADCFNESDSGSLENLNEIDEKNTDTNYIGQRLANVPTANNKDFHNTSSFQSPKSRRYTNNYSNQQSDDFENNDVELYLDSNSRRSGELADTELEMNQQRRYSRHFTLSPETTDYDSNCGDLDSLSNDLNGCIGMNSHCLTGSTLNSSTAIIPDFSRLYTSMPVLEDGLSSGHASDTENNNPMPYTLNSVPAATTNNSTTTSAQINNIFDNKYIASAINSNSIGKMLSPTPISSVTICTNNINQANSINLVDVLCPTTTSTPPSLDGAPNVDLDASKVNDGFGIGTIGLHNNQIQQQQPKEEKHVESKSYLDSDISSIFSNPPTAHNNANISSYHEDHTEIIHSTLKDIRSSMQQQSKSHQSPAIQQNQQLQQQQQQEDEKKTIKGDRSSPVWLPRHHHNQHSQSHESLNSDHNPSKPLSVDDEEADTDLETDRLLGQQRLDDHGFYDEKTSNNWCDRPSRLIKSPSASLSSKSMQQQQHHAQTFSSASIRQGIGTSSASGVSAACANNSSNSSSSPPNQHLPKNPSASNQNEFKDNLTSPTESHLSKIQKSPSDSHSSKNETEKVRTGKSRNKEGRYWEPAVLIEGVLFRARYLGSTQLVCEGQPTKSTRMMQAEEAVSRIKAPEGETQPSTEVDLFISTEKIMVLNTDLKEIMMDHALRTISYIADIGDLVVLMARRRFVPSDTDDGPKLNRTPKMICHVFESDEAQFIAQSIGQAFQVAYMEFLKANGIEDHSFVKEMDYQEVLNSQEIFGDELEIFAKKELQKEVVVPKTKGEILGMVIVESGWGSMLPTVVIANLLSTGAAARCGQLNIGDQIIAINGLSLVGLPLSTCQTYIRNTKNQTAVKFTVVPCPPVVEVKIKRPNTKYQLGFSVQNGVICSLLRGGIAERGGVRVGHRIIEINNQSVVAVPHEKIVNLLATSVGEILMKTMPTSMFRLLTGQENPVYI